MKNQMRLYFSLFLLSGIILTDSCKTSQHTPSGTSASKMPTTDRAPLENTHWRLTELNGRPVATEKEAFIELTEKGRAGLSVTGNAGCNNIRGTVTLPDNGQIHFGPVMSTKMTCPDIETEYQLLQALGNAENYTISGNTLSLNKARMAPLARFTAIDNTRTDIMEGTWELVYLGGNDLVFEELFPNDKPTLVLNAKAHTAEGSGTCNRFNASIKINGRSLVFGPVVSTKMFCKGAGEAGYFKALQQITGYSVSSDGQNLTLFSGDIAILKFIKRA